MSEHVGPDPPGPNGRRPVPTPGFGLVPRHRRHRRAGAARHADGGAGARSRGVEATAVETGGDQVERMVRNAVRLEWFDGDDSVV